MELEELTPSDLIDRLRQSKRQEDWRGVLDSDLPRVADPGEFLQLLKDEVDRFWTRDPNISLHLADVLIHSARMLDQPTHVAIGYMARGDSLRYLGRYRESGADLDEAARMFLAVGDEVGWARTCIGALVTAHRLGHGKEKLPDADRAQEILLRHGEWLRAAGMAINAGVVAKEIARYVRARQLYDRALEFYARAAAADPTLVDIAQIRAAKATANKATLLTLLGQSRAALPLYEAAERIFVQHGETVSALRQRHNIARVLLGQGDAARALRLLDDAFAGARQAGLDDEAGWFALDLAECYLRLNRFSESLEVAQDAVLLFEQCGSPTEAAKARFLCALVHGRMGGPQQALDFLAEAAHVFDDTDMVSHSGLAALQRATLYLGLGDNAAACAEADKACYTFDHLGMPVQLAQAQIVRARAGLAIGDLHTASKLASAALENTRDQQVPWVMHEGHDVLGRSAHQRGDFDRALQEYEASVVAIERVQSRLPTELRTEFLMDKLDTYHAAIECALTQGRFEEALDYLERSKSRALVDYLTTYPGVRIHAQSPASQALLDELAPLRAEHNLVYERLYGLGVTNSGQTDFEGVEVEQLRAVVKHQERRIGRLLERIALSNDSNDESFGLAPFDRDSSRPPLDDGTALLEYYVFDKHAAVFVVSSREVEYVTLPTGSRELMRSLRRWQLNLDLSAQALGSGDSLDALESNARALLGHLYRVLIQPVADRLAAFERVIVIPYGPLHSLPFHALHTGSEFLLQALEVSVCPSSSVLRLCVRRPPPAMPRSALSVAWSENGILPYVVEEARVVDSLLPGRSLIEQQATRQGVLDCAPRHGVVHFAAHGEARLDNPTFAHVKLSDGQLTTADVFSLDVPGALVTLSACETGRSLVTGGQELVGLSPAFLSAGARTVVQSLWRVDDRSTARLMELFYTALTRGAAAGAALREAQLELLATHSAHPYIWAPFQLVGSSAALTPA